MSEDRLRAAVAAGVSGSEESYRRLLGAIVEVARSIFQAKASSVLLLDEATNELVFEAVAGEGEEKLLGTRLPGGTGIAGWVAATRQPLVLEDVDQDPRFARDAAESTGYVPKGLMAVPLLHDEEALGVLSVLDRQAKFTLQEMELLGLFASQAAVALDLHRKTSAPVLARPACRVAVRLDVVSTLVALACRVLAGGMATRGMAVRLDVIAALVTLARRMAAGGMAVRLDVVSTLVTLARRVPTDGMAARRMAVRFDVLLLLLGLLVRHGRPPSRIGPASRGRLLDGRSDCNLPACAASMQFR